MLKAKREQERAKITLRKTFEGDLTKKMELTFGTAKREAKERIA